MLNHARRAKVTQIHAIQPFTSSPPTGALPRRTLYPMRTLRPYLPHLAIAFLTLVSFTSSCGGGGSPKEQVDAGYASLGSGKSKDALASFESALTKLTPADADYLRAKLGVVEALVRVDAERSKKELIDLAKAQPGKVTAKDYLRTASFMVNENRLAVAAETLEAGESLIKDDPKAIEVKEMIKERAKKATDPGEIARLKSLGYL